MLIIKVELLNDWWHIVDNSKLIILIVGFKGKVIETTIHHFLGIILMSINLDGTSEGVKAGDVTWKNHLARENSIFHATGSSSDELAWIIDIACNILAIDAHSNRPLLLLGAIDRESCIAVEASVDTCQARVEDFSLHCQFPHSSCCNGNVGSILIINFSYLEIRLGIINLYCRVAHQEERHLIVVLGATKRLLAKHIGLA